MFRQNSGLNFDVYVWYVLFSIWLPFIPPWITTIILNAYEDWILHFIHLHKTEFVWMKVLFPLFCLFFVSVLFLYSKRLYYYYFKFVSWRTAHMQSVHIFWFLCFFIHMFFCTASIFLFTYSLCVCPSERFILAELFAFQLCLSLVIRIMNGNSQKGLSIQIFAKNIPCCVKCKEETFFFKQNPWIVDATLTNI